ncbi:MAG: cation-transporting P-type ATPase [Ruminococcaceae bacterium]|nr:cation-transporting P-type ATPase [Oscillospiraceae bacterium]
MNLLDVDLEKSYESLCVDTENGLSSKQVLINRKEFCTDAGISKKKKKYSFRHFFDDVMRILFVVMSFASYYLYKNYDSAVSLIIFAVGMVLVNLILFLFEKNDKRIGKHKYFCIVRRDGRIKKIKTEELVPGDIIILKQGDYAPCDGVIISAEDFRVLEFGAGDKITAVEKLMYQQVKAPSHDMSEIPYHKCLLFADTIVIGGAAEAIVMNTGSDIYEKEGRRHKNSEDEMPRIYKDASFISKQLSVIWILMALLYFACGVFFKIDIFDAFRFSCILVVASVSDLVSNICAAAMYRQLKRLSNKKIYIQRLSSVDFIGDVNCITVHSSDFFYNGEFYLNKYLADDSPHFFKNEPKNARELLLGSVLTCSRRRDTAPYFNGKNIDLALRKVAKEIGIDNNSDIKNYIPIKRLDYSETMGLSYGLYLHDSEAFLYVRGRPEAVIRRCGYVFKNGGDVFMNESDRYRMLASAKDFSDDNEYVIAVARRHFPNAPAEDADDLLCDLSFVGLLGLYTPINANAAQAVNLCTKNDINVILMTTGDPGVAYGLAKTVSAILPGDCDSAITPYEYRSNDYGLFIADLQKYKVFCNLMPHEESAVISAHQKDKDIVASFINGVEGIIPQAQTDVSFASIAENCNAVMKNADVLTSRKDVSAIPICIRAVQNIYANVSKVMKYMLYWQLTLLITSFLTLISEGRVIFTSSSVLIMSFFAVVPAALSMVFDELKKGSLKKSYNENSEAMTLGGFITVPLFCALATSIIAELFYRGTLILGQDEKAASASFVISLFSGICFAAFSLRKDKKIFIPEKRVNLLCFAPLICCGVFIAAGYLIAGSGDITGMYPVHWLLVLVAALSGVITMVISELSKNIVFKLKK